MIWANIKHQMLNWLSHVDTPKDELILNRCWWYLGCKVKRVEQKPFRVSVIYFSSSSVAIIVYHNGYEYRHFYTGLYHVQIDGIIRLTKKQKQTKAVNIHSICEDVEKQAPTRVSLSLHTLKPSNSCSRIFKTEKLKSIISINMRMTKLWYTQIMEYS